jgi:hypothetical protein
MASAAKKLVWGTIIFMSLKGTVTLTLIVLAILGLR